MALATYVPNEVTVDYGGHIVSGWAVGARINIDQPTDDWLEVEGTDLVSRSLRSSNLYLVTITLQQTSISNDKLSFFANQDKRTKLGYKQLLIKDNFGTTKIMSPNAYIRKKAPQPFADEVSNREWIIVCPDVEGAIVGGNITV